MGFAKRKMLEDEENGYTSGKDIYICHRHIEDNDIKKFIESKPHLHRTCTYCNKHGAIHWDILMELIVNSLRGFYDDPANGFAYGYSGDTDPPSGDIDPLKRLQFLKNE